MKNKPIERVIIIPIKEAGKKRVLPGFNLPKKDELIASAPLVNSGLVAKGADDNG